MFNLAVFCSGAGSNFQALYRGIEERHLPAQIVLCVSDKESSGAIQFARANNIETLHLSRTPYADEESYSNVMLSALHAHHIDFILLAGYLKKIPQKVIAAFPKKILNIHPALLPKFGGKGMYGLNVHEAVINAGETTSGATVHFVNEEYDKGEIILQRTVEILPDDTPLSLSKKILTIEHEVYIEALQKIISSTGQEKGK